MKLRPYQQEIINNLNEVFKTHKRVLLQLPTGLGKTVIASEMARQAKGFVFFVVHRAELLQQAIDKFKEMGLEVGSIVSGKKPDIKKVTVAMIQTLVKRDELLENLKPELLILDECHLSSSSSYQKLVKAWTEPKYDYVWRTPTIPQTKLLGLTATPCRLDGKALGLSFETIVEGKDIEWGIQNNYLADFIIYGSKEELSLSGIKTSMGDFSATDLENKVNTIELASGIIQEYKKHLAGKQVIAFCVTVRHARELAAEFVVDGVPAACIDGETPDVERRQIIKDYRQGKILVLTNVNICIEGLDIPNVQGVIFARPTKSMVVYRQAIGRGLRPKPNGEKLIIIDHVGNCSRLGFPNEPIKWSLEGRATRAEPQGKTIATKMCQSCCAINLAKNKECVVCSVAFPLAVKKIIESKKELVALSIKDIGTPLVPWSREFWNCIKEAVNVSQYRSIAKRAGFKEGFGWYMYKAFVKERKTIPSNGYVKI